MVDIITPYALAILLLPVMAAWARDPTRLRNLLLIWLWDIACLVGVVVWARATRDYWPNWSLYITWALWFIVGLGAIWWTILAHDMVNPKPPEDEPPEAPKPPMGAENYVAPTVYGHGGARVKYVYRGSRARKGRR